MNLIYMCVFHQPSYIILLKLLMISIFAKSNINKETTDILIITSPHFYPYIHREIETHGFILKYYLLNLKSLFEAGCARLNIFNYKDIDKYEKILYLDTDILINSDINIIFNLDLNPGKIYALKEGIIGHQYWGGQFFDFTQYDKEQSAFTSGILLFTPSDAIKSLFDTVWAHIIEYIYKNHNMIPICLDQPFIVYNAIMQNKYDNQLLKSYIENNPTVAVQEKIIYHFPGNPGSYNTKFAKMCDFWRKMNSFTVENKKYSWENSHIIFFENGLMDGFGSGTYMQLNNYTFQAFFGGRLHTIVFNEDYTEFVSTRKDDNQIVEGRLL